MRDSVAKELYHMESRMQLPGGLTATPERRYSDGTAPSKGHRQAFVFAINLSMVDDFGATACGAALLACPDTTGDTCKVENNYI